MYEKVFTGSDCGRGTVQRAAESCGVAPNNEIVGRIEK